MRSPRITSALHDRAAVPRRLGCLLALWGGWLSAGCADQHDEISQYRALRPAPLAAPRSPSTKSPAAEEPAVPTRMLAAILPRGKTSWFFKLTGAPEAVAPLAAPFRTFLQSISFQGETPHWQLPAGWTERPGSSMRFATLVAPGIGGETLELSVTRLPLNDPTVPQHLLANISRWRGQLGLPPLTAEELPQVAIPLPVAGETAHVVDLLGKQQPGAMMGSAASQTGRPSGRPPRQTPPEKAAPPAHPPAPSALRYTAPPEWTAGKIGGMRKAAFEVVSGEKKVEITVIDLSSAAGNRLDNINRWRGQIQLPPLQESDLSNAVQKLPLGSATGDYVRLTGPAESGQSILGVIVDQGDKVWFVKLQGNTELAEQERGRFEAFAASLKFAEGGERTHGQ